MASRTWLAPDLADREAALLSAIHKAGWAIRCWPRWVPAPLRRLSQSHALTRRIYLRDELEVGTRARFTVLAHEFEHARRAEEHGRLRWVLNYSVGPVLVVAGLLLLVALGIVAPAIAMSPSVANVSASALGVILLVAGALAWPPSERFRRREEIYGFAAGAAASAAYQGDDLELGDPSIGGWTLAGYAWPYLVGGRVADVRREIGSLGIKMQEAERGD